MKILLPIAALIGGAFFVYFGIQHKISLLSGAGFILFAIGLVLVGFDNIFKRQLDEHNDVGKLTSSYSGASVVFIGVFWCLLGLSVFILGIFFLLGIQEEFLFWMKLLPAIPLLLSGAMLISFNLHEFLGSKQERTSFLPFLGSLPKRVFSALLICIGIGLCLLGFIALIMPAQYQSIISAFTTQYENMRCSLSPVLCEE